MPAFDNAHASIVGIADYDNIRKLPKARYAEDLAAALVDPALCGYHPKNVAILLDKDATRDKIRARFEALKRSCDADLTVFIYSPRSACPSLIRACHSLTGGCRGEIPGPSWRASPRSVVAWHHPAPSAGQKKPVPD